VTQLLRRPENSGMVRSALGPSAVHRVIAVERPGTGSPHSTDSSRSAGSGAKAEVLLTFHLCVRVPADRILGQEARRNSEEIAIRWRRRGGRR
jgi:hypothetical protein